LLHMGNGITTVSRARRGSRVGSPRGVVREARAVEPPPTVGRFPDPTVIARIRAEAESVKDCFTRFSFQAIALSGTIIGLQYRYILDHPIVALTSIPVIVLLMAVRRIGIHKYSTANRNYGFQLAMENTRDLPNSDMRDCGWEEGLKAWRIVQSALFDAIYHTPTSDAPSEESGVLGWLSRLNPFAWVLRKWRLYGLRLTKAEIEASVEQSHSASDNGEKHEEYLWYLPDELLKGKKHESHYHAGTYLREMFFVLDLMQWLAFLPLLGATLLLRGQIMENQVIHQATLWLLYAVGTATLLAFVMIPFIGRVSRRRRQILERELLSIPSCAIAWQAVLLAHHRATISPHNRRRRQEPPGYTHRLAKQAKFLADNSTKIHSWLAGDLSVPNNQTEPSAPAD